MRRLIIGAGLLLLRSLDVASAQTGPVKVPGDAVAFVNVHVIPMDSERVKPGQTVLVSGGQIAAIGAAGQLAVPGGAMVVDGAGRYLLPGLTDAHVHLVGDGTGFGTARPDFGDGPLYLAYGVTTVFNSLCIAKLHNHDSAWVARCLIPISPPHVKSADLLRPAPCLRARLARHAQYDNHERLHSALGYQSPVDYERGAA